MADIFISYSKQESELTISLARDLERRGYTTWWDTSLQPGEEFPERILSELDNAKVVIVIWTAHSVISKWVQAEAKWAADRSKLVTVRSPELDPGRIPLPFNTRHTDLVTDTDKIFGALVRFNISPRFARGGGMHSKFGQNSNRPEASRQAQNLLTQMRGSNNAHASLVSKTGWRGIPSRFAFDKVHLALGVAVVALMIATIQLVGISRSINLALVSQLEPHPAGIDLQGRYLFPNYTIVLNIIGVGLVLVCFLALTAAFVKRKRRIVSPEVVGLRQDIDDIARYVKNIIGYIYGGDQDVPRFDIVDVYVRYDISTNGDTIANADFEIHCTSHPAHFWKYWIDADTESNPVLSQRQLYFEVTDTETMQKLDCLPASNDPLHKVFVIFFPEMKPGERKKLHLSYFWPGYMKKLTELGATNFDWSFISQRPEKRARCRIEWIFGADMPVIRCRATGRQSKTAILRFIEKGGRGVWQYENESAVMDSTKYSVEFSVN